ncbi:sugar phosphate nucleotidyltransferase [Arthrobacter sp. ATA002]|nr:sugar phosphate nucleotidyltransferase [Arthrobacter sp. ATA002]
MHAPRILTIILAGGTGGRLGALTEHRAKPAMPVAGSYRLIDVPLSNLHNSGFSDVWIVEQYMPKSLNDHLVSGRPGTWTGPTGDCVSCRRTRAGTGRASPKATPTRCTGRPTISVSTIRIWCWCSARTTCTAWTTATSWRPIGRRTQR